MLFHVSVIDLACKLLHDHRVTHGGSEYRELRHWARDLVSHFITEATVNPLLYVEALFWRPEKGQNADVARHYGLLDGPVALPEGVALSIIEGGEPGAAEINPGLGGVWCV
jgi:hypothetical protein